MKTYRTFERSPFLLAPLILCLGSVACNTQQDIADLQEALNTYVQNKSIAEEFVRDVKRQVDPTSPVYPVIMESYYDARDSYNHYLDVAESAASSSKTRGDLHKAAEDAEEKSVRFLQDATRALEPSIDTRGIAFQKAVIIPTSLPSDLHGVSDKTRQRAIKVFDRQARWPSWREL